MSKKSDLIRVYIVIGLTLVLVVSAYFRFIHGKTKNNETLTPSTDLVSQLNIPVMKIKDPENHQGTKNPDNSYLQVILRDIFSPVSVPQVKESKPREPEPPKPAPSFKLKGTIVGGKKPIAIIDDQFVRTGEWIGEYEVAWIGKKEVVLKAGNRNITLEILKNE